MDKSKKIDITILSVSSVIILAAIIAAIVADSLGYKDSGFPISCPFIIYVALILFAPYSVIYGIFSYLLTNKIMKPALCLLVFYIVVGVVQILISTVNKNISCDTGVLSIYIGVICTFISLIAPLIMKAIKKVTT